MARDEERKDREDRYQPGKNNDKPKKRSRADAGISEVRAQAYTEP